MKTTHDFGVVTACYERDYLLAKATCASIRHFCPNTPICLVADGDFSVDELVRQYDISVIRPHESKDDRVRKLCSRNQRSKLTAIWEGPFERFLYLDSDAIFWGNVLPGIINSKADFALLRPDAWCEHSCEELKEFYLDPELIPKFDPDFRWKNRPYFCSGAFATRRDIISVDEWLAVEEWRKQEPTLFSWTRDQGILNYLILSKWDRGILTAEELHLQVTIGNRTPEMMKARFPGTKSSLPEITNPVILHFAGKKPYLQHPKHFADPFTYFRLRHYQNIYGEGNVGRMQAWRRVIQDEAELFQRRAIRKLSRMFGTKS